MYEISLSFNEPSKDRKKEIARALGVQENYFDTLEAVAMVQYNGAVNLPVALAAKLMKKSKEWIMQGLRDGVFPWGYAVKLTNWSYFISAVKFTEYTGIKVPNSCPGVFEKEILHAGN